MDQRRFILFLVLSFLIFVGWAYLQVWLFPPRKPEAKPAEIPQAQLEWLAEVLLTRMLADPSIAWPVPAPSEIEQAQQADRSLAEERQRQERLQQQLAQEKPIELGGPGYKLRVVLSSTGAAVRFIELTQYQAASRFEALPVYDPHNKSPVPFRLVSDSTDEEKLDHLSLEERWQRQSFRLTIPGKHLEWKLVEHDQEHATFEAVLQPLNLRIRRQFHLSPDQYHVDMVVTLSRLDSSKASEVTYELTGPRGLPIEGEFWKQTSYWQVVIGTTRADDARTTYRYLFEPTHFFPQDKRQAQPLHLDAPSAPYTVRPQSLQYAGVMIPYFAALVIVADDPTRNPSMAQVIPEALGSDPGNDKRRLWGVPVSVKLVSRPVAVGEAPVEHRYLLYAGPAKVRLLRYESGVRSDLPERYENFYHLANLTDYPWYTFCGAIGWTALVVFFTNLMHALLEWFSWLFSPLPGRYGFAILLLTVVVRGLMFPISRKQALNNLKMQQMAPELKKLQEKYKDDKQALARGQMELYRKYGVNPFSGCLIVLLQMPVFLGLYYALYESVHLRLAGFLWIRNLAAPDMLLYWGNWPVISQLAYLLHLGPYLHLLPIVSIIVMIWQQKMFMPPTMDEQQRLQMQMMNWMMVFMGYLFYWIASGLCLYFIMSSLWGLVERKLLPKTLEVSSTTTSPPAGERRKSGKKRPGKEDQLTAWQKLTTRLRQWWEALLKAAEKRN
ncbi:MAG: membrane protein insertase YidC [Gemmatales bacterium]|nr:membrane protein insertase YidC [Gemmatales bacterium]MDW7994244.1 membrane protein insertase YidC [Gemmatales bacterium]